MSRPSGSKNKPKQDIMKADGYAEAVTGTGTSRDRSTYARVKSAYLLDQNTLNNLYLGDGFARKIVDSVAEEMTRKGFELEDLENEDLAELVQSKLQELHGMKHLTDALRWDRLFGGAVIVYGLNDGGKLEDPLNDGAITDVEFIRVYDRWQANIHTTFSDANDKMYGQPELWLISPHNSREPYYVHSSRVHVFNGKSIPDLLRQLNQGWGVSALQSCYDQLIRLGMSHQYANAILERSQQAIHAIPNLADTLRSPGGEAMVQKRVDIVDMVRGILNTIVIDGQESYDIKSFSLAGVTDLLDRFAEAVSAVSGIPVPILMGKSQGGISNTSKGEMDAWHATIGSLQEDKLLEPLDRLVTYIIQSQTGENPSYKLCFKSLVVLSEKEEKENDKLEAETDKLKMETASGYVAIGSLDANEVRAEISEEYNVTGELTITPEDLSQGLDA